MLQRASHIFSHLVVVLLRYAVVVVVLEVVDVYVRLLHHT